MMTPIQTDELFLALKGLSLNCAEPHSEVVENLSELSQELGWMLKPLGDDNMVPDPTGDADFGFFLQGSLAFERRLLFANDFKVLAFGYDGGGSTLFISELHGGRVGLVWDQPEDVLSLDFANSDERIVLWKEEFLTWLTRFQKYGHDFLDEPSGNFE